MENLDLDCFCYILKFLDYGDLARLMHVNKLLYRLFTKPNLWNKYGYLHIKEYEWINLDKDPNLIFENRCSILNKFILSAAKQNKPISGVERFVNPFQILRKNYNIEFRNYLYTYYPTLVLIDAFLRNDDDFFLNLPDKGLPDIIATLISLSNKIKLQKYFVIEDTNTEKLMGRFSLYINCDIRKCGACYNEFYEFITICCIIDRLDLIKKFLYHDTTFSQYFANMCFEIGLLYSPEIIDKILNLFGNPTFFKIPLLQNINIIERYELDFEKMVFINRKNPDVLAYYFNLNPTRTISILSTLNDDEKKKIFRFFDRLRSLNFIK